MTTEVDPIILWEHKWADLIASLGLTRPEVDEEAEAKEWDESEHPRVPAGSGDESGEWTSGGGGGGDGGRKLPRLDDCADTWALTDHFGAVDLSKSGQEVVERTVREMYRDYDLPRFQIIGVRDLEQPAQTQRLGDGESAELRLFVDPRFFSYGDKGLERARQKLKVKQRAAIKQLEEVGQWSHSKALAVLKATMVDSSKRWVDFTLAGVVRHELGHALETQIRGTKGYRQAMRTWKGDASKLSLRAKDSRAEYVAEAFGAYRIGRSINPNLARAFDSAKRLAA